MTLGEFSSILSLRFYHTGLLCVAVGGGGRFCIAGVPVVKYALLWSPLSVPKGRIRAQWGERATALLRPQVDDAIPTRVDVYA